MRIQKLPTVIVLFLLSAAVSAQGPASCGLHLDAIADGTSTYASVAGMPGAPGAPFGLPPGAPGNPYTAYATPGSSVHLRLAVPGGTLGPAPFGPGSTISIMWSLSAVNIPVPPFPGMLAPCQPGQVINVSVLPAGGAIVDGVGFLGLPPVLTPQDPGHPGALELTVTYPVLPPATPVLLQALVLTPTGSLALSNAVSILPGPSPWETSLAGGLAPCAGGGSAASNGWVSVPTPPGFAFYGVPTPLMNVHVDGFVDFLPPGPAPCDPTGEPEDLGCFATTPETRPRVDVNHFDGTLVPGISDLTREFVPPTPGVPGRVIIRWKNLVDVYNFSMTGPNPQRASMVCEIREDGRIIVVRQHLVHVVGFTNWGQIGIGPGAAGQGYTSGPPLSGLDCLSIAAHALWGYAPYAAAVGASISQPGGLLEINNLSGSLAFVFTPVAGGAYSVAVY